MALLVDMMEAITFRKLYMKLEIAFFGAFFELYV